MTDGKPLAPRPAVPSKLPSMRDIIIEQMALLGKQLNPEFNIERFKQECSK